MLKSPKPTPGMSFDEALAWLRSTSADDATKRVALDEAQPTEPAADSATAKTE